MEGVYRVKSQGRQKAGDGRGGEMGEAKGEERA